MSKICDRNYKGNNAYTVKMIDGKPCCPLCEKPTYCHGENIEIRAMHWSMSNDTGASSYAIAKHMVGQGEYINFNPITDMPPPSDADDRGRCIRLLELIPEWLPRLDEMKKYDAPDKKPDGLIINSSGISAYSNSWSKQIPLIVSEGNFARPS